jgi:MFS family permease
MTTADSYAAPAVQQGWPRSGFWTVVFAFLIVMAFATLPSSLYGLYRERDDLSAFMITVIYGIFAGGTIVTLRRDRSIAPRIGRRGMMLSAVGVMMVAAGVLAAWKGVPGLLIGRLLTGVSVGLAAGAAITYLMELRLRADPKASMAGARTIGTSVNVGALGVGPLIAGCLAQWVSYPLTVPFLVFLALGAVALVGLWVVPETGAPTPPVTTEQATRSRHPVRLPIPAAAATLAAFSAMGLFAGLSGLFLATTLHRPSHALSGATLFLVFSCGVVSQLATARLQGSGVLALGTASMLIGLVLLVVSVRLSTPSLVLFLIGGGLDRSWRRRRLQGDHRDRARSKSTRRPPGHDVGPPHRPLRRTLGSGDRRRSRAQPGRKCTKYCARVRHPGRAGCFPLGLGAAGTPSWELGPSWVGLIACASGRLLTSGHDDGLVHT